MKRRMISLLLCLPMLCAFLPAQAETPAAVVPEGVVPVTWDVDRDHLMVPGEEAAALYERLAGGEVLTIAELKADPTVAKLDALSDYYKALYGNTADINTPEREALREELMTKFLSLGSAAAIGTDERGRTTYALTGPLEKGYKLELVLGLSASGKSTRIVNPDSEAMHAFVLDVDIIKEDIPEYKESHGAGADAVHFEGKAIFQKALKAFTEGDMKGVNAVLPIVATDLEALFANYIDPFEKAGYEVTAKFCEASPDEAACRVVMRALHGGQIINSKVAFSQGYAPEKVYRDLSDLTNIKGNTYAEKPWDFFDNEEINRLIDENYKEVQEKGYAELRIPLSLHHISEDYISPDCLDAGHKLLDAGYTAYVVGGAIRDLIIHEASNDFDITTNATVEQMKEVLGDVSFHTVQTGYTFGMALYPGRDGIDVATNVNIPAAYAGMEGVPEFEPASLYSENIVFDSFQRDLPMNALYYDLATGDLVDFHGGLYNLREKFMDTMVDPEVEFTDNPPSAIRALRFKARYQYRFSDRVEKAMRAHAQEYFNLMTSSTIAAQLRRFFPKGYARRSYDVLVDYGVFTNLYPVTAEIANTSEYQEYCRKAMDYMDIWYDDYGTHSDFLSMAVFLWPVIERGMERAEEKNIFTFLSVMAETVEAEHQRYRLYENDAEFLYQVLLTEYMLDQAADRISDSIMDREEFTTAFVLLQCRSEYDESLNAKVRYWAGRLVKHLGLTLEDLQMELDLEPAEEQEEPLPDLPDAA